MLTELLKKRGVWIYGLDMDGQAYTAVDFSGGTAIIVGAEGAGLSKLVREKCDFVISIPMRGKTASLNASNAATVVLFAASDRLGGEL
jgi:23S rRNA (guanosine2251-2'-O)-methyltransferase